MVCMVDNPSVSFTPYHGRGRGRSPRSLPGVGSLADNARINASSPSWAAISRRAVAFDACKYILTQLIQFCTGWPWLVRIQQNKVKAQGRDPGAAISPIRRGVDYLRKSVVDAWLRFQGSAAALLVWHDGNQIKRDHPIRENAKFQASRGTGEIPMRTRNRSVELNHQSDIHRARQDW